MSRKILFAALMLLSVPAVASDYVIEVHGIVCSFCSQGVTKKVAKLPFIDSSKYTKGVHVEIEKQKVTIAVKPDHELDIEALFDAIRSGGYDPVEVRTVTPSGEPGERVEPQS